MMFQWVSMAGLCLFTFEFLVQWILNMGPYIAIFSSHLLL
jgi:hypothetical protein